MHVKLIVKKNYLIWNHVSDNSDIPVYHKTRNRTLKCLRKLLETLSKSGDENLIIVRFVIDHESYFRDISLSKDTAEHIIFNISCFINDDKSSLIQEYLMSKYG